MSSQTSHVVGTMDAKLWQQVKIILGGALELPESARAAYLDLACANDPGVRAEVVSLLDAARDATDFIETPAHIELGATLSDEQARPGMRVGPHRLEQKIGQGGMGVVYLATRDDGEFQGKVAIKLLPQWLASDDLLRRFRKERQILATLDHLNIARLLDGGTTSEGSPYIVMEYVVGETIDRYCDVRHLNIQQRLRLFLPICSAVQYAHQHLVIHRDLKPGNIMVSADGVPKLLDFGIAKLLDPDGAMQPPDATHEMRLFTPGFASPEQIRNEAVTTATDVHALGIVLFLLLTGRNPFCESGDPQHKIIQAVCENEASRPSDVVMRDSVGAAASVNATASARPVDIAAARGTTPERMRDELTGDLDSILGKALAKEPASRYATVSDFAADLRRFQDGMPITARPRNRLYEAGKFVRRHRWSVASSSAALIGICIAVITALWQASVANAERARAEQHFASVRKLANVLMVDLNDEIEKGPTKARQLMVDKAMQYINTWAAEDRNDPSMQQELASAHERVARILGNPQTANLGDPVGATTNYEKSIAIRAASLDRNPNDVQLREDLARSHDGLGNVLIFSGKVTLAHASFQRALALIETNLRTASPNDAKAQLHLAERFANLASVRYTPGRPSLGDMAGAFADHHRALALRELVANANPGDAERSLAPEMSYQVLADLKLISGYPQESLKMAQRAESILESAVAKDPDNVMLRRRLAICYRKIAHALAESGDDATALAYAQKSLAIREAVASADPANVRLRRDLALGHGGVANILEAAGAYGKALVHNQRWAAISAELSARNPGDAVLRNNRLESHSSVGDVMRKQGNFVGAIAHYNTALVTPAGSPLKDHGGTANIYAGMGAAFTQMGSIQKGQAYLRRAVTIHEALVAADGNNAWAKRDLAHTYSHLADNLMKEFSGKSMSISVRGEIWSAGCDAYRRSHSIWTAMQANGILSPKDRDEPARLSLKMVNCTST